MRDEKSRNAYKRYWRNKQNYKKYWDERLKAADRMNRSLRLDDSGRTRYYCTKQKGVQQVTDTIENNPEGYRLVRTKAELG